MQSAKRGNLIQTGYDIIKELENTTLCTFTIHLGSLYFLVREIEPPV